MRKAGMESLLIILPNICLLDLLSCGSTQNIVASCICIWRLQFSKAYKLRCMSTAAATWTAQSAITVSSDLEPQNMVRQLVRIQGNITTNKTEEKKAQNSAILYSHKHICLSIIHIYIGCAYIYIYAFMFVSKIAETSCCIFLQYVYWMYICIHTYTDLCVYINTQTHM